MLIVQEESWPVCYLDWAEWREVRPTATLDVTADLDVVRCFCPFCWGAGRIMEYASNGEGMIPTPCPRCFGEGSLTSPAP